MSDASGQFENYVKKYPDGPTYQITNDGGSHPVWAPNGQELFYQHGSRTLAVNIELGPLFVRSDPRVLFEGEFVQINQYTTNYDVTPDGQRFLMIRQPEHETGIELKVILNWFEELKRLVPTGK